MSARVKSISGGQVFAAILTFFCIIIAVNATMAIFAMRSWTGLVVKNGYVASQAFNAELAEARRQAEFGWQESFGYADGRLTLMLSDQLSHAIEKASVNVRLQRPSTDRDDRQIPLTETAPGRYEAAILLAPGLWDVEAVAHAANGQSLRRLYRFQVAPQ